MGNRLGNVVVVALSLVLVVGAAVLAPPASAAGETRSGPYDKGTQCVTRQWHVFTSPPAGPATGQGDNTCERAPDLAAQATGDLRVGEAAANYQLQMMQGGGQVTAEAAGVGAGRRQDAVAVNVRSPANGKVRASANVAGAVAGMRLCLTILAGGNEPTALDCTGTRLSTEVATFANTTYTIQVTLYDQAPPSSSLLSPCADAGPVTCHASTAVGTASAAVTVEGITYFFV
jgi:hypothetical protein